jgi:hypothetical protein
MDSEAPLIYFKIVKMDSEAPFYYCLCINNTAYAWPIPLMTTTLHSSEINTETDSI